MTNNYKIEICCGSAMDAINAYKGGAYEVELCSDLFHGGLTPSIGTFNIVRKLCPDLKIMCMARPREGGFFYNDLEFESMIEDAKQFIKGGADGIVFGFLNEDGTVDIEKCEKMMDVIGDRQSVFHRAIDVTPNWKDAMDSLIKLGVTRVLTSGQKPTVAEGIKTINEMIEYSCGKIQVLPGGGITPDNIDFLIDVLNVPMMHVAIHQTAFDRSTQCNPLIFYGGCVYPPEDRYSVTVSEDVAELIKHASLAYSLDVL